jgi:hypothetical protein
VIESYAEAGPQLALGGLILELLLGSMILRWGVAWRNRLSNPAIRVPDLGKALAVVGLALLICVPLGVGFTAAVSILARGSVRAQAEPAVAALVLVFFPFLFVCFFLLRAGIMAWLLRISWDDALVVQICETVMYFVAGLILGIAAVALFWLTS